MATTKRNPDLIPKKKITYTNPDLIPKKRLANPSKKPKATANYRGSGMSASAYAKKKSLAGETKSEARYQTKMSVAERRKLGAKANKSFKMAVQAKKAAAAQKARRTTRSADPTPGRAPGR